MARRATAEARRARAISGRSRVARETRAGAVEQEGEDGGVGEDAEV